MEKQYFYGESELKELGEQIRAITGTSDKFKLKDIPAIMDRIRKKQNVPVINGFMYVKYYDDISPYRNGTLSEDGSSLEINHTLFPLLTEEDGYDYQNFTFFGWFEDEKCSTAISPTMISGSAYAKFLLLDFVRIATESDFYDNNGTPASYIAAIYCLHDLNLKEVGTYYKRTDTGSKLLNKSSSVYKNITPAKKSGYGLRNKQYYEFCEYFKSFTLSGIPSSIQTLPLIFSSYRLTRDSTEIEGPAWCGCVADNTTDKIMKVPVIINADEYITSFEIKISYDSSLYTFEGIDNECDEISAIDFIDEENGIVKIQGTLSDCHCILKSIYQIKLKIIGDNVIPDRNMAKIIEQKYMYNDEEVYMRIPDLIYRALRYVKDETPETETQEAATSSSVSARKAPKVVGDGLFEAVDFIEDFMDFSEVEK